MSKVFEPCFMCGKEALTEDGVIYVRAEIKGKWGNHIICLPCWKKHYRPDADPKSPPEGLDYTNKDYKADLSALKKKGLIIEKPKHDWHLTSKGREVARSLALRSDPTGNWVLSKMQRNILQGLFVGD